MTGGGQEARTSRLPGRGHRGAQRRAGGGGSIRVLLEDHAELAETVASDMVKTVAGGASRSR
jgi:hypothetical protein